MPEPSRKVSTYPSPIHPGVEYPETMGMAVDALDFGLMLDENTMLNLKHLESKSEGAIHFHLNMLFRELKIEFKISIQDWRIEKPGAAVPNKGKYNREEYIRFTIPFTDLTEIRESPAENGCFALTITLQVPPRFFRRESQTSSHDNSNRWTHKEVWYRQTDVIYNTHSLMRLPVTLKKTHALLDLGRWTTYRFVFNDSKTDWEVYQNIRNALSDYNVKFVPGPNLELVVGGRHAVWEYIDRPVQQRNEGGKALQELLEEHLSFRVRYQLEVCISHGYLNEYSLDRHFTHRLATMEPEKAQDLLECIANEKKIIFKPNSIFESRHISGTKSSAKIPEYCTLVRAATVTPTTIRFHTPTVETSNRVVRQYSDHADRFLRVRFTDEQPDVIDIPSSGHG